MKKILKLIHLGSWYKCYGDDAKVISFITDYKLFEDNRTLQPTIGFPESSIDKVVNYLNTNKISYTLVNDSDRIYDFGEENNYERFLHNDLPFSYVVNGKTITKKVEGSFTIKFENEDPENYVIGENISSEAELTKKIIPANEGDFIVINNEKVELIKKDII